MAALKKAIEVVEKLRDPIEGCPWDLKQTRKGLAQYAVEESYEYVDSVNNGSSQDQMDELGDILLQVLLNGIIAEQDGEFTLADIANNLTQKMIRRHPHVFKGNNNISIEEIKENWHEIKNTENKQKGKDTSTRINDEVLAYPSLICSEKIGKKSGRVNFDWETPLQVAYKVEEEWQELKEEVYKGIIVNKDAIEEEFGDFLFSAVQLARHLELNAELALRKANIKFLKRFRSMESLMEEENMELEKLEQEKIDHFWNLAKLKEKEEKNATKK